MIRYPALFVLHVSLLSSDGLYIGGCRQHRKGCFETRAWTFVNSVYIGLTNLVVNYCSSEFVTLNRLSTAHSCPMSSDYITSVHTDPCASIYLDVRAML